MISKEQFIKRIQFLKDRERFLANQKRKKPMTLDDIPNVAIPKIPKKLIHTLS